MHNPNAPISDIVVYASLLVITVYPTLIHTIVGEFEDHGNHIATYLLFVGVPCVLPYLIVYIHTFDALVHWGLDLSWINDQNPIHWVIAFASIILPSVLLYAISVKVGVSMHDLYHNGVTTK